jgi:hypothetical protein
MNPAESKEYARARAIQRNACPLVLHGFEQIAGFELCQLQVQTRPETRLQPCWTACDSEVPRTQKVRKPLSRIPFCINKNATAKGGELEFGAAGGDRTHDPWLRRPILYPLSYSRTVYCADIISWLVFLPSCCKLSEGRAAIISG